MNALVLISLLVSVISVNSRFTWKSCGVSDYATVNKIQVSPNLLVLPGTVKFDTDIEIKNTIKNAVMSVNITRNGGSDIAVPCVKQFGSCQYKNMCSFFEDMVKENWGDIGTEVGNQFFSKNLGVPKSNFCATGLQPQIIRVGGSISIPTLPSILQLFSGDYTVRLEINNSDDNSVIACVEAKASLQTGTGSVVGKRSEEN